ncbi:sugar transporter ERD6-like 6 [Zerene cesonia]|uniref:sugar transporter ERD6-like 6 n=1 Tax=Zerene cesonia TaxID=33412 RepID=UPI0018E5249B|nr:sugar transporter ERD6-like 6 [Zerene cesonia]
MHTSTDNKDVVIVAGLVFCCISDGYIFGQMSGMIDALAAPNSPIPVSQDDISWIASTINMTSICGFVIVGILSKAIGRRLSTTILGVPVILCWIALYFAQDKFVFLFTRVIVGVSYGGIFFQTIFNCGEYLPPNIRQFACNIIISLGNLFGVMLGHILSLLMDWRNVALLGIIPSGLACLLPLFWIESPFWLASKGKFDKCEKAFKSLRQANEVNEAELRNLIAYEKKNQSDFVARHSSKFSDMKKVIFACKELYFWKITAILFVVNIYRATAGRVLLNTLAITMIQEITGRTNVLLFTLLVDGFGIIGSVASFYLIKKLKMRKLLFISGIISNTLLVVFSASLYFVPNEYWYPWIKVVLMASYYIVVNAGPYPVLDVFIGEVHPLEIKEFSGFLSGSIAGGIHFLSVQLAASMFATMGYSGTFLFNAFIVSFCLVYLSVYMPETKGRTLQEIEIFFKTGKFDGSQEVFSVECANIVLVEK